jgi:ABC-type phosphate transport system substrate-binding protein
MKHFITLFLASMALAVAARAADYQLIAHPATGTAAVSKEDVKSILLGNKIKWPSGTVIKLAVLAGGPAHDKVISDLTARTSDQFEKYWKKQVFTGKGVMPEVRADDAAMVAYVAKHPGAFGYVSAGATIDGVKAVAVQ